MAATATRPATSLRLLCETAANMGISWSLALEGTGVQRADLADPSAEVTVGQEMTAVENVAAAFGTDVGLGVAVGRRMHVHSFGIWGFAILTSPTFRAAIETAMAHIRLSYVFADIAFHEDDERGRLVFALDGLSPAVHAYVLERHSIVTLHFASEVVTGPSLGARIETTRSERYADALARQLGVDVVGEQRHDAITFPSPVLDLAVPKSDPVTLRYCLEQCNLLGARLDTDDQPWADRVRDVLVEDISGEQRIVGVARRLAVNERTLRRRLADEGTSFREVYTDTRLSIARELLEGTGMSVEGAARRVGFAEPASFVRAFARHFGETPGRVRRAST